MPLLYVRTYAHTRTRTHSPTNFPSLALPSFTLPSLPYSLSSHLVPSHPISSRLIPSLIPIKACTGRPQLREPGSNPPTHPSAFKTRPRPNLHYSKTLTAPYRLPYPLAQSLTLTITTTTTATTSNTTMTSRGGRAGGPSQITFHAPPAIA